MPDWSVIRDSVRWRLLIATAVSISLALLLAGWSLQRLFHDHLTRQFARTLEVQLDQLTARLEFDGQGQPLMDARQLSDPRWGRPYSGLYWQIDRVPPGQPVYRSRSLWDLALVLPGDALVSGQLHRHTLMGPGKRPLMALERTVLAAGSAGDGWRLIVAGDMQPVIAARDDFSGQLALSLGLLLLLLLLAAALQIHVGLAPMRRLRTALQGIQQGRTRQLEGRFPLEVLPLVADFNQVLLRNAELIERARTQAGNLAHAIKTPLAVMRQAAERASQEGDAGALVPLVQEQVDLAGRQINWHLARARAAHAAGMPGHAVDIGPVLDGLVRTMQIVHAGRALVIQCEFPSCGLCFAGEKQDLQEMLGNLLDNACKWARSHVGIRAERRHDGLVVVIEDDGPGIAADALTAAMQRGIRLDESVPGSGLGLSIVNELAGLYRGELRLETAGCGGVRATLRLPAIPPAPACAGKTRR